MKWIVIALMCFSSIWAGCGCGDKCECSHHYEGHCGCGSVCPCAKKVPASCVKKLPVCEEAPQQYEVEQFEAAECKTCSDPWGCGYRCEEFFPDNGPNFKPFIADPRQVCYSAAWRANDRIFAKNTIPVSFGDTIPIIRWKNVWPYGGDFEIDLEACVWAIFDPLHESSPLINADYYIGVPLIYAFDCWSFRLRGYHISSHIGDEYLLNHPRFNRKNPSAEYLDFYGSYEFGECIRVFAGIGYIVHQDESFRNHRLFSGLGAEIRVPGLGYSDCKRNFYGQPYVACFFRGSRDFKRHIDATYALGYEWGKICGSDRKLRLGIEYHDGYSVEGQFSHKATNYFAVKLTYGW